MSMRTECELVEFFFPKLYVNLLESEQDAKS